MLISPRLGASGFGGCFPSTRLVCLLANSDKGIDSCQTTVALFGRCFDRRKDVAAGVGDLPAHLFGRHVANRAQRMPRICLQVVAGSRAVRLGKRGGFTLNISGRQEIEEAIRKKCGGVWLELTPEQYTKLRTHGPRFPTPHPHSFRVRCLPARRREGEREKEKEIVGRDPAMISR